MSDATETNEVLEDKKCLFIQMELCREYTLKNWFSKHPLKRKKFTVINYMKQVFLQLVLNFSDRILRLCICRIKFLSVV